MSSPVNASAASLLAEGFGHHQAGRLSIAARCYRKVLAFAPGSADALRLLGAAALANAAHPEAKRWMERSLSLDPASPDAAFNLGNAELGLGRHGRAGAAFDRAGELHREWPQAHLAAGGAYHAAGLAGSALRSFRRAAVFEPAMLAAIGSIGLLAHETGDRGVAAGWFRRGLHLDPQSPEAYGNLGLATLTSAPAFARRALRRAIALRPDYLDAHRTYLLESVSVRTAGLLRLGVLAGNHTATQLRLTQTALAGRYLALARRHARRATSLAPGDPLALLGLGNLAMAEHDGNLAINRYGQALAVAPTNSIIQANQGVAAFSVGKHTLARRAYRIALEISPDAAQSWNSLGVLEDAEKGEGAGTRVYHRALALVATFPDARSNLATAQRRLGELSAATMNCRIGVVSAPSHAECMMTLGTLAQDQGRVDDAVRFYRRTLVLKPDDVDAERNLLYAILHLPDGDQRMIFDTVRSFAARHVMQRADGRPSLRNDASADRRLRLAYVSSDFRDHPNRWFMNALFEHRDRDAFDVACYHAWRRHDPETAWIRDRVDRFRDVDGLTDPKLADLLREDGIDIAVFVGGRFDKNRPLVAAYRAAPIQISYLDGGTSGVEGMDYWLTDDILHPKDRMDGTWERFTEELVRLPRLYDFSNRMPDKPVAPLPAETSGYVTFGSFAQPARITDDVASTWARILDRVPRSRITLKSRNRYGDAPTRSRIVDMFGAKGIASERIRFLSAVDARAQHLDRYASIDIALDTFPFSGATTNFEALWMGIPVVTLAGKSFVSRMATSILTTAGLPDLVAETRAAYVEKAVELARDHPSLAALRRDLRPRLQASALRDGPAYARAVEATFRRLWRRWCEGAAGRA